MKRDPGRQDDGATSARGPSTRLYRWLLLLYPPGFRRAFGDEMARTFGRVLEDRVRRRGTWGWLLHWGRTVGDLAVNVPAEWVGRGRATGPARRKSPGRGPTEGRPVSGPLDAARYELYQGARALLRTPGLALSVVTTLAVGIGVVTAFFSLVNALLLRPLPYAEPHELVRLQESGVRGMRVGHVSSEAFEVLREGARSVEGPAVFRGMSFNLGSDDWTESVRGARVGPDLLPLLGVRPTLGRLPGPADAFTGAETVVVLGHDLWRRRFEGDPGVLGRTVTLEGAPARVVGVMPEGFTFPEFGEIWAPFTEPRGELLAPGEQVDVVARLGDGVAVETARSEVGTLGTGLAEAGLRPPEVRLTVHEGLYDRARGFGFLPWLFLGAAGAVLLVVCSNVASLLLARGARRRSEMAIRSSLGASRGRLVGRTLLEGGVLAAAGGALGLLLSAGILRVFLARLGANFPLWFDPAVDPRVVAFAVLASAGSVLLFGLPPALAGSRIDLATALSSGGGATSGSRRAHRLRSGLIALEVALAFVLVAGGGLMATSVARMNTMELGVDATGAHEALLHLTGDPAELDEARRALIRQVLDRLSGHPEVATAGAEGMFRGFSREGGPPLDSLVRRGIRVEGAGEVPWSELRMRVVAGDYFAGVGLDVLRGRGLQPSDVDGAPLVAVASETVARRHWPGEDPLGRGLQLGGADGPTVHLVGVVQDRQRLASGTGGFRLTAEPLLYVPASQAFARNPRLVVRAAPGARDRLASTMRAVVREIDPRQAVGSVQPLDASEAALTDAFGAIAALMVALAVAGAGLAVMGIWGVIAQAVAERTREIGIRTAIGGSARRIVGRMMAGGLRVTLLGLAVGMALSLLLTRVLTSILYEVDPLDPLILGGGAALFLGVGLLATWLPARRAARVDPVQALRSE